MPHRAPRRARCSAAWESTEDARPRVIRCKRFIALGCSYCEACAETYVQDGEAHDIRCPACDEYGDFGHLTHERPAGELEETVTKCGTCGATCLILEVTLSVKLELMPP